MENQDGQESRINVNVDTIPSKTYVLASTKLIDLANRA